jgi:acyl carrier protein
MKPEQVHSVVRDFVHRLHPDEPAPPVVSGSTWDDLGVDSMSLIDLLFRLEREFAVTVPDSALPGIRTVGDVVDFVAAETTTQRRAPC